MIKPAFTISSLHMYERIKVFGGARLHMAFVPYPLVPTHGPPST